VESSILKAECDCRATEPVSSARCLFQAVRSYLHFSQLSAWLNTTHGTAPQYIGYRSAFLPCDLNCTLASKCGLPIIVHHIAIIMSVIVRICF